MRQQGIRRLLVLAGESSWSSQLVRQLSDRLAGDWLWVGDVPELPLNCATSMLRKLLGREFQHAVFDARSGLDAAALAALAGTLTAGSWLVLLTPRWSVWPAQPDDDSCRWSDATQAIAAPRFVSHLMAILQSDSDALLWRQNQPLPQPEFIPRPCWHPASGEPQLEQSQILAELRKMERGVAVVTAARGRGKSALAGMLAGSWQGKVLITAPAKATTEVLAGYAGDHFNFIAPDILAAKADVKGFDWLIIDEAAAIPAPLLRQLISRFPRVLLTTTVQGYEGTGRGFLLKFCSALPSLRHFTLNTPIRWAKNDPLERFIDCAMLFGEPDLASFPAGEPGLSRVEQKTWQQDPQRLQQMYRLLSGAHYRTSPLDWRRMLDAPGQHFIAATVGDDCAGALWMVEEGGLDENLSRRVWAGLRRPRGNLVAQSLAAHGGSPLAAVLRGLRFSRVAVHPRRQREHIGRSMVMMACERARQEYDYLSVSFGYTDELWRFWQHCGFILVRIGSHREASSGCYTAMALLPLSEKGETLTRHEAQRLARDFQWQQPWMEQHIGISTCADATLNNDDWPELGGFAFAHRPFEASLGALNRLLLVCDLPLPALRGRLEAREKVGQLCLKLGIAGRKALLSVMRNEVRQGLESLDPARSAGLQKALMQLQSLNRDLL